MLQVNHIHRARKLSKEKNNEYIEKPSLHLKENSEERHLHGGHQSKGMNFFFMVTATHVMNMVTKLWIVDIMQGKIMEGLITP